MDSLAMLIDRHCDIVLRSLEEMKRAAVRTINGEPTGRKVGSPISDFTLRMLHDIAGEDSSISYAYFTRVKNSVLMKSITIAIRNYKQRMIDSQCINMNLDVPFSEIMKTFIPSEM